MRTLIVRVKLFRILVVASLLTGLPASASAGFFELVVFGDSLSDTGNQFAAIGNPPPPYFNGRFSNGPVAVERLASRLGLPAPTPSEAGGTNYAFGGAQTGTPGIGTQVSIFQGGGGTLGAGSLVFINGGADDFFNNPLTDPSIPVSNLATHITTLAGLGGRNFVVSNLAPLGQIPAVRAFGPIAQAALDAQATAFNGLLDAALDNLETTLAINIFPLDAFSKTQEILNNPGAFGFTNITDPAFDETMQTIVDNPDEYLFWDGVHPTTAAHQIFGDAAFNAIPEPSALTLAGIAATLSFLAYDWRRRKQIT